MNISNKIIYFIIAVLIFLMILVGIVYVTQRDRLSRLPTQLAPTPTVPFQSPTPINVQAVFNERKIETVPTLNPTQGYGIDINSPEIISSKNEIKKISTKVPYKKTIQTGTITTETTIPSFELFEYDWVLPVDVYGVDYEITADDPEYNVHKQAFIAAAQDVYFWLKNNGVTTDNIIIQWGDRAFIQERSKEWLN